MAAPAFMSRPDGSAPTDPRTVPPTTPHEGDILDTIDDAIAQRCACGCRAVLDPNGPSQWYASLDCQRRWHAQHATDPGDVYQRRDAARVRYDHEPAPLTEPGPGPTSWLDELITVQLHTEPASTHHGHSTREPATAAPEFASGGWANAPRVWLRHDILAAAMAWYGHEVLARHAAAIAQQAEVMRDLWGPSWEDAFRLAGDLPAIGIVPTVTRDRCPDHQESAEPTDPMERALWLRRHRNTGPAPQRRAPRRIDPRRAR